MLHFILGRASSGKTEYLHKVLGGLLGENGSSATLIVPEQFTFETDKGILNTMGAVKSNRVDVFSFTRLAEDMFREYGKTFKPVISEQGRLIYMAMALQGIEDKLEIYKAHVSDKAFINGMVYFVDEIKQSASGRDEIERAVAALEDKLLKAKMRELLLILDSYDAVIENGYLDTVDVLTKLDETLGENRFFNGKTVAIDGFTSFNGQILRIIEKIMVQCADLYITLTADGINYSENENDVFAFTRRTAAKIKNIALKNNVPIAKPVFINSEKTGYAKHASKELDFLEENFYKPDYSTYEKETESLKIYCASTVEEECAYVARRIRGLLRENIRCREIAVIYRDPEIYEIPLEYAFRKYEIPHFEDSRQPVMNQPLIRFVLNALDICQKGFSTEAVLKYLKTGLAPLETEEISELENYVYLWSLDYGAWKEDFTLNPYGFDENTHGDEEEKLKRLNSFRKAIIEPLVVLKENLENKTGLEMTESLYNFLHCNNVGERLGDLAISLENDGEYMLASEQEQIWDILMDTLNELALALDGKYLTVKGFTGFLEMSISVKSLGRIPNGIDEVITGCADRIKTRTNRIVFVLGLNSGVFPRENPTGVILSDKDRRKLLQNGAELFDINRYKTAQERFISYNSLCSAREKLYLSYALLGRNDEKKTPSEIITMTEGIFPLCTHVYSDRLTSEEFIEGKQAAFETLAARYRENGFWSKNLLYYFLNDTGYSGKVKALERAALDEDFAFEDSRISTELFGKNMYLSASRIETYESCPFQYFCRFGMNAKPKRKAELDPAQSGTVIHFVLEKLMKKYGKGGLLSVSREKKRSDIKDALISYAESFMGGLSGKDKRFGYLFERLSKTLETIFDRLCAEFSNSDFEPIEFELEIGRGKDIEPYCIKLPGGGKVEIYGYIDRVDGLKTESRHYLRVVDYKTGIKNMRLSDVLNGLNMQMLIYLMTVWKNGENRFGENIVPSGVLYLPARATPFTAERNMSEEEIRLSILKSGKMNGLVLDDSRVIRGMDETGEGIFIPASIDEKTGKAKGNVISLSQLKILNKKMDSIISTMALQLQDGAIPAFPVSGTGHENTCEYCDYFDVCCHESSGRFRNITALRHTDALKELDGEEEAEDGKKLD